MSSPADAFAAALNAEIAHGSDFRLALEAVGGSKRELAAEMGVSPRTVQRWANYDSGGGAQARRPSAEHAGDLRAMADVQRQSRALERLTSMTEFDTDSVDVNYIEADGRDEGARHARTVTQKLDWSETKRLYQQGAPMNEVGAAFAEMLGASYFDADAAPMMVITNIEGLTLH